MYALFPLRPYVSAMLQRIAVLVIALLILFVVPALAHAADGTTIALGPLLGELRGGIEIVAGIVITIAVTVLGLLVRKYFGVSIDQKYLDALKGVLADGAHVALDRAQASSETISLDVKSAAVVHLVDHARLIVPVAVKRLKLDDDKLGEMALAQILKALPVPAAIVADPVPPAGAA
ncbi:hypothetical protein [Methylobacterium sp. WL6]|uniref:hypothetical protein n=1 Tax=Methylobacterium sp. WL6 TaxID=2603901 RepID=UPI0011C852BD|nr:hypothetical protein [Methylobacterium sp. WL6]TXN71637.1 hypothetical protein FV230_07770 [Methylobacterium sp. WL6]